MTDREIKALVAEGAKLSAAVATLERKKKRLDAIKAALREAADGQTVEFPGHRGSRAEVKQVADSLTRTLPGERTAEVRGLVGEHWDALFHAQLGADFEKNALRLLGAAIADPLVASLRVPSSARVSFP